MTNEQLILACKKGERKAQKKLYDQYSGQMYSICLRYCKDTSSANDALQTGFIRVFKYIQQFNGEGALGGWIRRIIVNAALSQIKLDRSTFLGSIEEINPSLYSYEMDLDFEDFNYQQLLELLNQLPEGYRLVFSMYVLDDLSHKEIADLLKISEGTSRSQLLRARKLLQEMIKKDDYLVNQYSNQLKMRK